MSECSALSADTLLSSDFLLYFLVLRGDVHAFIILFVRVSGSLFDPLKGITHDSHAQQYPPYNDSQVCLLQTLLDIFNVE